MHPFGLPGGPHVAIHPADTPEPASPPVQLAHTAPGGDGGHPGTSDGPAPLGRAEQAIRSRLAEIWPHLVEDPVHLEQLAFQAAWSVRDLLVRPEVGRVLELLREWRNVRRRGGYDSRPLLDDLAAAMDGLDQPTEVRLGEGSVEGPAAERVTPAILAAMNAPSKPTTGGPDHDGLTGAPLEHGKVRPVDYEAVAHAAGGGFRSNDVNPEPAPEPAGDGPRWVDRRGWTRQQWLDDTRKIFNSVHGGAADLLNGHIMALFGELHDVTEQRDLAIAHDRQPYPTADAYERTCAALEKHRERADAAETKLAEVTENRDFHQAQAAEMARQADRATAERDAARAELAEMQQRWQRAMEDGDDQTVTRLRLHRELREARAEVDQTRLQAAEASTLADSYAEQVAALEEELVGVRGELESVRVVLRSEAALSEERRVELTEVRAQLATVRENRDDQHAAATRLSCELDRLRADHVLIPRSGIVGFRVRAGYVPGLMIPSEHVEMVFRGDLGQEGETSA